MNGLTAFVLEEVSTLYALLFFGGVLLLLASLTTPRSAVARILMAGTCILCLLRYLAWRVDMIASLRPALDLDVLWYYAYFAGEMPAMVGLLILWLFQSRTVERSGEASRRQREMSRFPLVDVFIPTYNESEGILERTLAGATSLAYPNFRVWILDDGRRESMKALAKAYGVGYLTREDNAHAKAGNMNNGLAHVLSLDAAPEFVAILDADFVPIPQFLARTIPLFADSRIGLVQTPQHFFNPDPLQFNLCAAKVLADDQSFAQGPELCSRDAWGVATSCGTSSVVRVGPLRAIGGFPCESICEDTLTSIKLLAKGYKTAFLNEPLSQGLAVEGIAELLAQRGRWSLGNMQIVRSRWGIFSRYRLGLMARLYLLNLIISSIVLPVFRVLLFVAPLGVLYTGTLPIPAEPRELFWYLGPVLVSHLIGLGWISQGATLPMLHDAITSVECFATWRAGLTGLFRPVGQKFKVTDKGVDRERVVVHWRLVRWFLAIIALSLAGMGWATFPGGSPDAEAPYVVAWCYYNIVVCLIAIYICTDLPRSRRTDWFEANVSCRLITDGQTRSAELCRISPGGAVLAANYIPAENEPMAMQWEELPSIRCRLIANDGGTIEVEFNHEPESRRALTAKLFSGRFLNSVRTSDPLQAFMAAAARFWSCIHHRPLRG